MPPILLVELPYDVLFQILLFVNPEDIISIRQTCKTFCELSQEKVLWNSVADNICERNVVFRPAHSMQELNLSSLEAFATAPARWRKMMKGEREFKPVQIREISMPAVLDFAPAFEFLVPGGRFLLLSGGNPTQLALVDLDDTTANAPLATMLIPDQKRVTCFPSPDKQKLCIILRALHVQVRSRGSVDVYEISPYEQNCTFTNIASYDPLLDVRRNEISAVAISYDTIVFKDRSEPIMRFWKFRTDMWIAGHLDCPPIHQMILLEECLVFIHRNSFSICDIPRGSYVSRASAFRDQPTSRISPVYLRYFQSGGPEVYKPDTEDWYSGSSHFPVIVGSSSYAAAYTNINLYRIDYNKFLRDSTGQKERLWRWAAMTSRTTSSLRTSRPCEGGLYRTSGAQNGYLTCQGVIENDDGSLENVQQTVQLQHFIPGLVTDIGLRSTSLCPASGRCCLTYYRPQHGVFGGNTHSIYVIDFIGHPSTKGAFV